MNKLYTLSFATLLLSGCFGPPAAPPADEPTQDETPADPPIQDETPADPPNDNNVPDEPSDAETPVEAPVPASFQVSGSVTVANNIVYDFTTAESTSDSSNNSVNSAQELNGYITLHGYGSVNHGSDFYRISLNAGDKVAVTFTQSACGNCDFDLYLLDENQTLVDSSFDSDADELVIVPETGTYFIEVEAAAGAANYQLTTGNKVSSTISKLSSSNFVPGQLMVKANNSMAASSTYSALSNQGVSKIAGAADRVMLTSIGGQHYMSSANVVDQDTLKRETIKKMKALQADPSVQSASVNYIHQALATTPNDPMYAYQWHYELINLSTAWDTTTGTPASGDVIVAVADTGVVMNHPDLDGKLVYGYDFIKDPSMALDYDGIDSNPDDPGDAGGSSGSWHGTHVAGTIAAETNNGTGVAGVSWGAKIMPLRVLGQGGGTDYDIAQAVRYAAGLSNDSGTTPAQAADIINLSLGCSFGPCYNATVEAEYIAARNAGLIIVAAAGNDGAAIDSYPASYTGVISVASVSNNFPNTSGGIQRSSFSNTSAHVDVAAPGGTQYSDLNFDGYADMIFSTFAVNGTRAESYSDIQGTSMATPHIAGVLALMKAVNPDMTPSDVDSWLSQGHLTQDINGDGAAVRNNDLGYGMIDAAKAVAYASSQYSAPAVTESISASATSFDFGTETTEHSVTLTRDSGVETLDLTVTPQNAWISVTENTVDGEGIGNYTLTVNRDGLDAGTYNGSVLIEDQNGHVSTITLSISMEVEAVIPDFDITDQQGVLGDAYVLLTDANGMTVAESKVDLRTGSATFTMNDILEGNYQIIVGTDHDNDGTVCDPDEICSTQQDVTVTNNVSDIPLQMGNNNATQAVSLKKTKFIRN